MDIIKFYCKNHKKSISFPVRIELFIVFSALVLIISPMITGINFKDNDDVGKTELFLSPRCEELFGKEATEALLRGFGERNPDLLVRQVNVTDEKINAPDIFIFDEGDFNALVASDSLISLKFYSHTESGDEQLAIPLVSFMNLLFYNIELLKAAGFDRPPKTKEEFLVYSQVISGGNNNSLAGVSGAAISLGSGDNMAVSRDIYSWLWAGGGDFWQKDNGGPVINNKVMLNGITFLGRLYRENALAPHSFETTGTQRLEEFAAGKIAMMIASTRDIPALREKMGNTFGITAIPGSGSAGSYNIGLSGYYAGISSACEHPDEAWNFLVFIAEQSHLLCAGLQAVPGAVLDLILSDYIKSDPVYYKAWEIFAHPGTGIVRGFSGKHNGKEYDNIVREEFSIFFGNGRTATETADAIQRRWLEIKE